MNNKTESKFVDREFKEVENGYYDDYGFYYTPNGSKDNLFIIKVSGMPTMFILIRKDMIDMVKIKFLKLRWLL
jgi:hypothetical protein